MFSRCWLSDGTGTETFFAICCCFILLDCCQLCCYSSCFVYVLCIFSWIWSICVVVLLHCDCQSSVSLSVSLCVSEFVRPCKLSSGALLVCLSVCISVCVCVCPGVLRPWSPGALSVCISVCVYICSGVVRSCNLSPGALVVPVVAIISLGPRASPAVIATSSDSRRQKQRSLTQPTWRTAALWEWCYRYVICLSICLSQNRVGTVLPYESGATGMSSVCLSVCLSVTQHSALSCLMRVVPQVCHLSLHLSVTKQSRHCPALWEWGPRYNMSFVFWN